MHPSSIEAGIWANIGACDRVKKKTPRKSGVDSSITEGAAKRQATHRNEVEAEVKAELSDELSVPAQPGP
jgi:hypothetical protein